MDIGVSLPVRELQDDLVAIRTFAQEADELGFTHLRVPDLVIRPGSGHLHEPLMLLAWVAAVTEQIELVPSVIVTPSRQTVLLAKQATELDILSGGRLRLGVGVGKSEPEYEALGQDFTTRGARLEEQIELLRRLWTEPVVDFTGRWDQVDAAGINLRPARSIPIWLGPSPNAPSRAIERVGRLADGWFALTSPGDFPAVQERIQEAAQAAGRSADAVGAEASVAVVGDDEAKWLDLIDAWRGQGLTHLCLRTLGAGLTPDQHLTALGRAADQLR